MCPKRLYLNERKTIWQDKFGWSVKKSKLCQLRVIHQVQMGTKRASSVNIQNLIYTPIQIYRLFTTKIGKFIGNGNIFHVSFLFFWPSYEFKGVKCDVVSCIKGNLGAKSHSRILRKNNLLLSFSYSCL